MVKDWNIMPVVSLDHKEVPAATSVDLWESFDSIYWSPLQLYLST